MPSAAKKIQNLNAVKNLLFGTFLIIIVVGVIAYKSEQKKNPDLTLGEFLDFAPFPSLKSIFVGMVSSIVFGMIDNGGLFFGMDALMPYLPKGELIQAGLGNTYSNALGIILSTFVNHIFRNYMGVHVEGPLWSSTIGMVIGCLIGILVPALITGKR